MSKPKHESSETAKSSGHTAKHAKPDESQVHGWKAGSRTDRPHHKDGWGSSR